jgi:ribonuclease P/MRP protein subunit POP5
MKKGLKPSMRPKKRYIAFDIYADEEVGKDELVRALWGEAISFFGEERAADMNLWVMGYNPRTLTGFLVCRRDRVTMVRACLGLLDRINGRRVGIRVLGVSGTVKSLKRKFLNREKRFKEESEEICFEDEIFKAVRSYGECVDAVPQSKELKKRIKIQNRKFIGLLRKDIGW